MRLLVGASTAVAGCVGSAVRYGHCTRGTRKAHCRNISRLLRAELVRRTHIRGARGAARRGLERARRAGNTQPSVRTREPSDAFAVCQCGAASCGCRERGTILTSSGPYPSFIISNTANRTCCPVCSCVPGVALAGCSCYATSYRGRERGTTLTGSGPQSFFIVCDTANRTCCAICSCVTGIALTGCLEHRAAGGGAVARTR